jgi:hypothetical protein
MRAKVAASIAQTYAKVAALIASLPTTLVRDVD